MKKNQATNRGTMGRTKNPGVSGLKSPMMGSVILTKILMKKKLESSGKKRFIATRPIKVHMIMPRP